ncbi:hypothetical protein BJX65DRAFT_282765 [Aspergillus insuetus]
MTSEFLKAPVRSRDGPFFLLHTIFLSPFFLPLPVQLLHTDPARSRPGPNGM